MSSMPEVDMSFVVRLETERHTEYGNLFRLYADMVEIKEDGSEAAVGYANGFYLPHAYSDYRYNLDDICGEAGGLAFGTLDEEEDQSWLGITHLLIQEPYRGQKLGYELMFEILQAFPCHLKVGIKPGVFEKKLSSPEEYKNSAEGLCSYWERFGFKPLEGSPYYIMATEYLPPKGSWLRDRTE